LGLFEQGTIGFLDTLSIVWYIYLMIYEYNTDFETLRMQGNEQQKIMGHWDCVLPDQLMVSLQGLHRSSFANGWGHKVIY
jgi:hypothetical protein